MVANLNGSRKLLSIKTTTWFLQLRHDLRSLPKAEYPTLSRPLWWIVITYFGCLGPLNTVPLSGVFPSCE